MRYLVIAILSALPLPALADADRVHALVTERLGYMEAVAIWKWNSGVAVEDRDREAVVLESSVASAVELGLPEAPISRFFAAQIAAAKAIQFCWIDRFRIGTATPRPDPPDLVDVVRPAILDLGAQINEAIAGALDDPDLGEPDSVLAAAQDLACLDAWHLGELAESLSEISGN